MNIFAMSPDPTLSAQWLDDKRVVKMALESAQMLSVACHFTFPSADSALYGVSHYNHPCNIWCRRTVNNFLWLYDLGKALCAEYEFRYERRHKSLDIIELAYQHVITYGDLFPETAESVVFDFNSSGFDTGDVHEDYKLCLINKWDHLDTRRPAWKFRGRPEWYTPK